MPGPGSQVAGMGRALYEAEPGYRAAVDAHGLAGALWGTTGDGAGDGDPTYGHPTAGDATGAGGSTTRPTGSGPSRPSIDAIDVAQPAVFAHGVALAEWLAGLGLRPELVIGHSAGELVAACLAGVLSVADGLELARVRGRAMAATPPGRMAAIFAERPAVEELLAELARDGVPGVLGVAASNAPEQTVVSGDASAVRAAVVACEAAGLAARELAVGCGAHSALMADAAPALAEALARVSFEEPTIRWVSSVSAEVLERVDADYWVRQLRAPVDFMGAVRAAAAAGFDTFVELGGTGGLSACAEATLGDGAVVVPMGDKGDVGLGPAVAALRRLGQLGLVAPRREPSGVPRRLWIDAPARPRQAAQDGVSLQLESEPAIRDHLTGGVATAPAALLVDLALWEIRRRGDTAAALADVVVGRPLELAAGQTRVARVEALASSAAQESGPAAAPAGVRLVSVGSGGGEAVEHLTATVTQDHGRTVARLDLAAIRGRCAQAVPMGPVYRGLAERGFALGPTMRSVVAVWAGSRELLAELETPPGATRGRWLDAALLDGATQAVAALVGREVPATEGIFLGFGMGEVSVWEPVHGRCLAFVRLATRLHPEMSSLRFDVMLCDDDGHVLAEVRDFAAARSRAPAPARAAAPSRAAGAAQALGSAPVTGRSAAPPSAAPPSAAPPSAGKPSTATTELGATLRRLIGARLRRAPETLPAQVPLARLGMDSMKAVDLVRALETELGVRLPVTLLFEAQTLEALERVVGARLGR